MPLDSSVDKIRVRGRAQLSTGLAGLPQSFFPTVGRLVNKASHARIEMQPFGPYDNPTSSPDPDAPATWNPTTGDWWADLIAVDDADLLASGQTQWGQWGVDDRGQRYYIEPKLADTAPSGTQKVFYGAKLTGAPLAQGSGGIRTVWLDDLVQLASPTAIIGQGGVTAQQVTDAIAASHAAGLDTRLRDWTYSQSFRVASATRDANSAITTASILWPDNSTGTFTTTTASTAFPGAIDAYSVTYVPASGPSKTITQPAVTRDAAGAVTAQPALTLA